MSTYQKILVAVDGSASAKHALKKAFDLAIENKAQLMIAHVVDARAFTYIENTDRSLIEQAEKYGEELIEGYKKEALEYGVENVVTVLDFGSPKAKIPKVLAEKFEVDLIVSGATGLNAVERLVLGSVSEAITRHAPCDVLIVRN
ncbi:universal stress protein [Bacillaceae bacterium SIJ1]|uniref:universal stress protein n=1 Tax=Litoribacterium kuwaitense TaxID=1398745 RepID=UPI0013ED423A|nr:universal stress protein [Litoribacterium kuwaitense]NGP46390.1 universal stress protein [Litoribacterium kuwaitense]